jgi:polysaccharide pyruvyl transferase WcaK-like protein
MKISIFGHFGKGNFGNDSTLQATLYHLRRLVPNAEVTCICMSPESVAATYNVAAVPISDTVVKPWTLRNPLARLMRKIFIGVPSEIYRWVKSFMILRGTDALIVPGTGLLTDVYGLQNWGPYSVFKWTAIAKLCRCRVIFLSVGAGPLYSKRGRWLVRAALALADFRSYRDDATKQYLSAIGVRTVADSVSPDLAFSLPKDILPPTDLRGGRRPVIGLGLMLYRGEFSATAADSSCYAAYLGALRVFVKWLLSRGYDVRLLSGDLCDMPAVRDFKELLKGDLAVGGNDRIIQEPINSVENLLSQLMTTEAVVATRFHNTLLALLLNKPTISIAFHQKCVSLMSDMGLSEYSQKFEDLDADKLIAQFCDLEKNAGSLTQTIRQKAEGFRRALDDQYRLIFQYFEPQ